jgi:hypothetical protein
MNSIPYLLLTATLLPFFAFWVILILGPQLGKSGAIVSIGAICAAAVLSFTSLGLWLNPYAEDSHWPKAASHGGHSAAEHGSDEHDAGHGGHTSVRSRFPLRLVSLAATEGEHA